MTVRIVPGSEAEEAVWRTTLAVAAMFRAWPWVLIGAQMVIVLELEHGRPSGRTTGDIDAVVDVRVVAGVTRLAAERLRKAGFEPSAEHPAGSCAAAIWSIFWRPITSARGRTSRRSRR